jgi:hypothetical protein
LIPSTAVIPTAVTAAGSPTAGKDDTGASPVVHPSPAVSCRQYAVVEGMLRECLVIREKKEPDAWTTFDAPFVKQLRVAKPMTPILLVEDSTYANAAVLPAPNKMGFDALVAAGDRNLHYLPGDGLIGDDGEGTVDGSHPTDLGFVRQADAFADGVLRPLLAPRPR